MDFLLGILTGVALCLVYGNYLLRQRKKEEKKSPSPNDLDRVTGQIISTLRSHGYNAVEVDDNFLSAHLKAKLNAAIARDDFEEAARLRDLINKK